MKQLALLKMMTAARRAAAISFLCMIAMACSGAQQTETAEGHYKLGATYFEMGDLNGAIAEYQAALRLSPNHVQARASLCIALYANNDLSGAIAECQAALQLNPNLAEVHYRLGLALSDKGDLNKAIVEYRAAIRLDSSLVGAHFNLGVALRKKEDVRGAIAAYQAALGVNPNYVPALNNLAWLYATTGDATLRNLPKALEYALQAVALEHATNAHPLDTLAEVYYVNRDYGNAVLSERKALALQLDDATRKNLTANLEKYEQAQKQPPR
ncbi:MAG TPA: tetratricopeptide repeat protein [Candidatus Angelobacter sp.]|nr:tetratricopeptide repeat protein [Candidatus Angelobacter sp.]